MSRELFGTELGIHLLSANSDTGVMLIFGSLLPGGSGGFDDTAEVGSVYFRTNGQHYQKFAAGSGADKWRRMANADDLLNLSWRSDKVRAATAQVAPLEGGTIDLSVAPFSDDEAPTLLGADFVLGDAVIFGVGTGTPVIARVISIAGDVLTFTLDAAHATYPIDVLTDNDGLIVKNFLPDSPDAQESMALVVYNGTDIVKLADVNWDFATGINLSATYASQNGTVASGDTVEVAIQKLDGNQIDILSSLGISGGAVDMGTYTGDIIPDNSSQIQVNQALESAISGNPTSLDGVTAEATLDEVLVDKFSVVMWEVTLIDRANPANRRTYVVYAHNNGTSLADANDSDFSVTNILKSGSNFNRSVSIDINGVGVAQTMRLRIASTEVTGVDVRAARIQSLGY